MHLFDSLPLSADALLQWTWPQIEPFYTDLASRSLAEGSVAQWLADWSRLSECVSEMQTRLYVAATVNTADADVDRRYADYLDHIYPAAQAAEYALKRKLLDSGLAPAGFEMPLRTLRAEAALFREANLPLLAEEKKLITEFDKIVGAQTVMWEGQEKTLVQLGVFLSDPDRAVRERAWRQATDRRLADRDAIDALWRQFLGLRRRIAANAGYGDDYRAYRWQQLMRFDYTPEDGSRFQQAIEDVAVPAAERVYERHRRRLGLDALRPWDLSDGRWSRPPDPPGVPRLHPFSEISELQSKTSAIFHRVDPQLGAHFEAMGREGLLDLDNRKHKATGAYCEEFAAARRPFIFMNAVGLHDDVQTLLHESGHAFHVFEMAHLPYRQQMLIGLEIAEVASMSMELLAAPYLGRPHGGFYDEAEAARARVQHLEEMILFWPYMAVVDAFQHWVYANPGAALDGAECDAQWSASWKRYLRGVDWSGLEREQSTLWRRQGHIFQDPFYYVEYGLAQLGAIQVWRNALKDQAEAVACYRRALSLGGTRPLPQLFQAAGARLAFDAGTLREAIDLMQATIDALDPGSA
jgi:oligoendopeptidase F